ncbi:glycosyltransferase family 2 protein [Sporosarcina jiandibaonis]|uniref:glycosyltransferase family 2 protein n=1 Tax=Sporosarcina jiandibaonis TaxID=2715535 RepID=UPI00155530FC|nr:glycosyltransferase family 2 protein [Sporosarcina jiandibaonis]
MVYLYITLVIFVAFIIFQSMYILIPLFKKENRHKIKRNYSFSVLVPAFNEGKVISQCISGFQQLNYSAAELIIINDGSTDDTLAILKQKLKLLPYKYYSMSAKLKHNHIIKVYESSIFPNIYVIDKLQGGKADALNAGINFSVNEVVITLDADSILDQNSLLEMNAAFQDFDTIACGGNVLIAQAFNGEMDNLKPTFKISGIIRYQFLQYLTAFYLHKRAQASLRTISVIAGAFGAFRKEVLVDINGFRNTIGEDMDITLKLHLWIKDNGGHKRISFVPTAMCYTECPTTLIDLFKQRVRWQKAFIDCLIYYRRFYFVRLSKRFSIFFLLDQFIIGTLNAFPVVLMPLLLIFHKGHYILFLLFGTSAVLLFMYQSITTIYVSSVHGIKFSKVDIFRILLFLPIEIFVFRLVNLSFVIYGTLTYFYQPQKWNKVERSGDLDKMNVKIT